MSPANNPDTQSKAWLTEPHSSPPVPLVSQGSGCWVISDCEDRLQYHGARLCPGGVLCILSPRRTSPAFASLSNELWELTFFVLFVISFSAFLWMIYSFKNWFLGLLAHCYTLFFHVCVCVCTQTLWTPCWCKSGVPEQHISLKGEWLHVPWWDPQCWPPLWSPTEIPNGSKSHLLQHGPQNSHTVNCWECGHVFKMPFLEHLSYRVSVGKQEFDQNTLT